MADDASSALFSIRRSMRQMNDKVHNTLNAMVNGAVRTYLQDAVITCLLYTSTRMLKRYL